MHQKHVVAALSAAGALAFAGVADAGIIEHSGGVPLASTNWDEMIDIPQFDDLGGTRVLKSVTIYLKGTVEGDAQGESLDMTPATIQLDLAAEISLSLGATVLASVLPIVDESFNASAHDGTIDFGGTSGVSFLGGMNMEEITEVLTDPPMDLSAFIGIGMVTLTGSAEGMSSASGAGNLISQFSSSASMEYRVTYDFNVVPAPPVAALGLIGAPFVLRRRR